MSNSEKSESDSENNSKSESDKDSKNESNHSWESKEQFGGYFYEKFHGPQQELSDFIKQLYQALDVKYQEYLKQKEEKNYKSVVGKIKKLSPKRIEELKEFILNEYGNLRI